MELKFDKPVFIKNFYIRPHLKSKAEEDHKQIDFEVTGYYNDNLAFTYKSKIEKSKKWVNTKKNLLLNFLFKYNKKFLF